MALSVKSTNSVQGASGLGATSVALRLQAFVLLQHFRARHDPLGTKLSLQLSLHRGGYVVLCHDSQ